MRCGRLVGRASCKVVRGDEESRLCAAILLLVYTVVAGPSRCCEEVGWGPNKTAPVPAHSPQSQSHSAAHSPHSPQPCPPARLPPAGLLGWLVCLQLLPSPYLILIADQTTARYEGPFHCGSADSLAARRPPTAPVCPSSHLPPLHREAAVPIAVGSYPTRFELRASSPTHKHQHAHPTPSPTRQLLAPSAAPSRPSRPSPRAHPPPAPAKLTSPSLQPTIPASNSPLPATPTSPTAPTCKATR